jgi:hypothetical protein
VTPILLQAEIFLAEGACARARARRDALIESIAEMRELLAERAAMSQEQIALAETRLVQRTTELDRFNRTIAQPAEALRLATIARLMVELPFDAALAS